MGVKRVDHSDEFWSAAADAMNITLVVLANRWTG